MRTNVTQDRKHKSNQSHTNKLLRYLNVANVIHKWCVLEH